MGRENKNDGSPLETFASIKSNEGQPLLGSYLLLGFITFI